VGRFLDADRALARGELPLTEATGLLAFRHPLLQYSGVLSIGAMSVAMILATRAAWLEN